MKKIGVIGGGVSGLTTAFFLRNQFPKHQIVIYEKSQIGGAINTSKIGQYFLENGPRSIRMGPQTLQILKICDQIKTLENIVFSQNYPQVFLYYDDQLRSVPRGQSQLLLPFIFLKEHPRVLTSLLKLSFKQNQSTSEDITLKEFVQNQLTKFGVRLQGLSEFIIEYMLNPVMKGIYSSSPDLLSKEMCFDKIYIKNYIQKYSDASLEEKQQLGDELKKKLEEMKSKKVSSFTFKQGLGSFTSDLENYLKSNSIEIIESGIESIDFNRDDRIEITSKNQNNQFEHLITAVGKSDLQGILRLTNAKSDQANQISNLIGLLDQINHTSLVSVSLGFDKDIINEDTQSFGYLIPSQENLSVSGVIFDSAVFPSLSPNGKSKISVLMQRPLCSEQDLNEKCVEIAFQSVMKQLNLNEKDHKVECSSVKEWNDFFTVYQQGHFNRSLQLIEAAKEINPNFSLHGKFLFTSSIPELTALSKSIVNQIQLKN